jgi:UDP-N-acetyl-D-glucosamine/UDP-N-acetyl-D-galactosamine dehydrogenase
VEVLEASGTKRDSLPFRLDLAGGHHVGVDPYYLTLEAAMLGYHPEVVLAGRRKNDSMATFVAQQTAKQLLCAGNPVRNAKVIVLELTFKETCSAL